jgi:hypothetical protein
MNCAIKRLVLFAALVAGLAGAARGERITGHGIFGVGSGYISPADAAYLQELGVSFRRVPFAIDSSWTELESLDMGSLEAAGAFDQTDPLVSNVFASGLRPYMVANLDIATSAPTPENFGQTIEQYMARYNTMTMLAGEPNGEFGDGYLNGDGYYPAMAPVPYWEILNEVTPGGDWSSLPSDLYADYLQQSRVARQAVLDDMGYVLNGAMHGPPYAGGGGTPFNTLALAQPDVLENIDAVSYEADWWFRFYAPGAEPGALYPDYLGMRQYNDNMQRLGQGEFDPPTMITRGDWSGYYQWAAAVDQYGFNELDRGANHLVKSYLFALASGAESIFHPTLRADAALSDADNWVALIDEDGTRRSQFYAFKLMSEMVEGLELASVEQANEVFSSGGDTAVVLRFEDMEGESTYAVWDYFFDAYNYRVTDEGEVEKFYLLEDEYGVTTLEDRPDSYLLEVGPDIVSATLTTAIPLFDEELGEWIFDTWEIEPVEGLIEVPLGETPVYVELNPIPEPVTLLLVTGAGLVALRRRR